VRPESRLTRAADFARVRSSGQRVTAPELVLYHFAREEPGVPRVGFSVGRKLGGAVIRNRIRRRLREAIRPLLERLVACDLVVVARPPAVGAEVADLSVTLESALTRAGLLDTSAPEALRAHREGTST
jgi:ribonuclease P protein component